MNQKWKAIRKRTLRIYFGLGVVGFVLAMSCGPLGAAQSPWYFVPMGIGAVLVVFSAWKMTRV